MTRRSRLALLLASCSTAAFFALGLRQIRATSASYDEPVHLAAGYLADSGSLYINALDHPPFAEMWAAAALMPLDPSRLAGHPQWGRLYNFSDAFLYKNRVDADRMLGAARGWSLLTWGALFCAVCVLWGQALGGTAAAAWAGLFAATTPLLYSNAAVVATDAASAALFSLVFFLLSRERRTAALWCGAGAAAGLALASKFNMIALPGFAAACLLAEARVAPERRARPAHVALACAAAVAALALVYKGNLGLYWEGLTRTLQRLGEGRSSFFHGARSTKGWLLYFPVGLALKTPLPALLLAAGGAALAARRGGRDAVWAVLPPAAYFSAACLSKTQIGIRHALPVAPFMIVWAALAAERVRSSGTAGRLLAAVLAAAQLASVALAPPDALAYFNAAAGGPRGGYRWLVDSNLDWGQGLKSLAAELEKRGRPRIYLSYFGTADPSYYGISYCPVAWSSNVERRDGVSCPERGEPALLAISATNLQAVYFADAGLFSWLSPESAAARPDDSIFLFDLTADPAGRRRLAELLRLSGAPKRAASAL